MTPSSLSSGAGVLFSLDKLPFWSVAAAYVLVALLLGVVVRLATGRSLARIAAHRRTELSRAIATTVPRPAAVAVVLVVLADGLRLVPREDPQLAQAHRLVAIVLALLGVAVMMRVAFRSIDAFGRSNPELRSSAGIGKAVAWVVGLGVAAVVVSDALGISLAPALTALGVSSLAVALALQDTLSNFFSGVYIVVDKPVRPGDFIRVDPTHEGYVESIGWRSTHLRTLNNNLVIIPNATLSKAVITNYSLPTPHVASSVRVDVAADADLDKTGDALADEARRAVDIPGVAAAPAPGVVMSPGFVDGGVGFTVYFQARSFVEQYAVQDVLRRRIAARLKKEGVALAQVTVAVIRRE